MLAMAGFSVCLLWFLVYVLFCFLIWDVSTSAIDCLERFISEMTYHMSSGTLKERKRKGSIFI